MVEVGSRVVRGPDWKWEGQDGGEGHCGTVIEIGRPASQVSPDKTVIVVWDMGRETNYRAGYDGYYDLRVLDNAPTGVKHQNIICDGCKKHGIVGMRFKCTSCFDYDLCLYCYMSDKHDLTHVFQRFDTANAVGVELGARKGSPKVTFKGIFVGAKVARGPHWEWNDQDGGKGKAGRVLNVLGWDNETGRSVVNVIWSSGFTNIYRVGHKGKVDIHCVEPAIGGTYYRDHLPVLGKKVEVYENNEGASGHLRFSVGDKVKVIVDVDTLKKMQEGHGGWNPHMVECVGATGVVHRVTDRGDIRVFYDTNMRWTLNPASLAKLHSFSIGDVVRVQDNVARIRHLQKGHGEWIEPMISALGKLGKVIKIYPDGDLRVTVEGRTWTLNPLCVQLVPGSSTELNNIMSSHTADGDNRRASLLATLMEAKLAVSDGEPGADEVMTPERLIREAAQGHLPIVRDYLTLHPDKVDIKYDNKTCLQVASHEGHLDLARWLLSVNASINATDHEGDTPLHYAAFGQQPQVMGLLLENGADVNAVNNSLCSALHVSVSKLNTLCVKLLLKHNCKVNLQDKCGDTCLHDAIGNNFTDVVDLLTSVPEVDLTLRNKMGFNPLQFAALKGKALATEKLISRSRQLVDVKKDDGFAALHLACLNGHRVVADTLITAGRANINITNNRRQTPLMLAASQGHASVVELLVCCGADLNAVDEDGDTCLHMVLIKRASISTKIDELEAPTVYGIWQEIGGGNVNNSVAVAIACYLVQEGCSLEIKNNPKERTPIDLVGSTPIPDLLNRYLAQKPQEKTSDRRPVECSICSELSDSNTMLEPCGHRVACEDCTSRLKKCLKCSTVIARRVTSDGRIVPYKPRHPSAECVRYLETKIAEIEEVHCCSICMERRKNVAFLCGHGACDKCSATLRTCHMCRKTITKKINLY